MPYVSTPFAFPFCVPNASDVGVTVGIYPYYIGVSYETAFEWYWRGHTWALSGYLVSCPVSGDPPDREIVTSTAVFTNGSDITSESQLVCPGWGLDMTTEGGVCVPENSVGWSLWFFDGPDYQMVKDSGLYYPAMAPLVGPGDATKFSIQGNTYGGWSSVMDGPELVIQDYWAYDPGDGAVWDTTTGAQLRNPFSIQSR
jgi:hypothetical protein